MADADLDPRHHTMLDDWAERIVGYLDEDRKVLVRCQAGINRSGLVVALAMLRMGWTADAAIARIREVRSPYALFNQSFTRYLHAKESA
jgi:protein-tyrosine phosphatase